MSRRMSGGFNGVLALDLGTKTGYAWANVSPEPESLVEEVNMGTWKLATDHELRSRGPLGARNWDPRVYVLYQKIWGVLDGFQRTARVLTVWEDVQFIVSRDQAHLWSGLRSAVWIAGAEWCAGGGRLARGSIPTGSLKKYATQDGSADKAAMDHWAIQRGLISPDHAFDDNAVDARWVFEYFVNLKWK